MFLILFLFFIVFISYRTSIDFEEKAVILFSFLIDYKTHNNIIRKRFKHVLYFFENIWHILILFLF